MDNKNNLKTIEQFENETIEYKEDPYAYKIAILYFLANGMSAAMSTTLSPLSKTLTNVYEAGEGTIWYINSVFTLYFIFFNFPANYCIDKFGVKKCLTFAVVLTMIGAWMRTGIDKKLSPVILGQTMMAIAGPFIVNCIAKVSNMWFTQKNRVKMTSLMASSYMFGLGFGFFLTSFAWSENLNIDVQREEVESLMQFSAIVCTVISIPVILYFRDEPSFAPSRSAEIPREEFFQSFFILIKNRDYNFLSLIFSIGLGNFITMTLMIHHVISPFNYSEYQISNIGLIINFSSGISKVIIAFVAGKFLTLKKLIFIIFISISISTLLLSFTLSSGSILLVYFTSLIYGFFCQMYWGPAIELASEIAFPVSETNATGNLFFGGCIMGVITNYVVVVLYETGTNPSDFLIYLFFSYAACVVLTRFVSDNMKREEFETFNNLLGDIKGKKQQFLMGNDNSRYSRDNSPNKK